MLLFFDTETTGLPHWNLPSDHPDQPYVVELAAMLTDVSGQRLSSFCSLVRPRGWTIEPGEAADIHGITTQMCERGGVEFGLLWEMFEYLMHRADVIIAHSVNFDKRILRIALKRHGLSLSMETLKAYESLCTMNMGRSAYGNKVAKLQDLYAHLFGKPPVATHRAGADVIHCRDVYVEMKQRGN